MQKVILGLTYEMEKFAVSLNNTFFGKTEFKQNGLAQDPVTREFLLKTEFDPKIVTDLAVSYDLFGNINIAANINNVFNVIPKWKLVALTPAGQAILNDPAQAKVQRNLITFNGRYDIMTYDGYHFSQLGRIYNLSVTYKL